MAAILQNMAEFDEEAAMQTVEQLYDAMMSLSQMPLRYPYLNDVVIPMKKYRKMYVPKYHLVLYYVIEDKVYVDYIVDTRQDYKAILH